MSLSTSRQQFLAYETHAPDDIQYGRKGGVFVTTCVCLSLVLLAVAAVVVTGVLVYFITYYKLTTQSEDFWDDTEPFGQVISSEDMRLPPNIVPSFYRLKLKTDLDASKYSGVVYITIRAEKSAKKIILHSKDLSIRDDARLTEQIYEKVYLPSKKTKRQAENPEVSETNATEITPESKNEQKSEAAVEISPTIGTELPPTQPPINELETPTSNVTIQEVTNNVTHLTEVNATAAVTANSQENSLNSTNNYNNSANVDTNETNSSTINEPNVVDTQVTHSSVRDIQILSMETMSGDRLVLNLANALRTGVDYTLELNFEGNLTAAFLGFYKSSYVNKKGETRYLATTQFEPVSARAAFPCFDEPALKATFEISLAHARRLTALSNMRVATREDVPDRPDWVWTHFERSLTMSTYLVAYVICDFVSVETQYVSTDNSTKPIRIWAQPDLINKAQYALNITPVLLSHYERMFGLPYALDKIDLIAIPDFASGAMENWGLVTFRETALLLDPQAEPAARQAAAVTLAHELAHQWFGNLVTMRWWTDLWLNEGFATFVEYEGVDKVEPTWLMNRTMTQDKMDLFRSDALKNTSPISRRVTDAAEITQKFDEISYMKGANVIRMLKYTITPEVFNKGLNYYLNEWKFKNAEENDLWTAMDRAVGNSTLSVVEFMNSWSRQAGYPLVTARRNYTTGRVELKQELFTTASSPYPSLVAQTWRVPVTYARLGAPADPGAGKTPGAPKTPGAAETSGSPETPALHWLRTRTSHIDTDLAEDEPLYINVDAIGYYRVNYDQRNWDLLQLAIDSNRVSSPVARAQLVDDAFNLARAGLLPYAHALQLAVAVRRAPQERIVWTQLLSNLAYLKFCLWSTPAYAYFQDYVSSLISAQLTALGGGRQAARDHGTGLLQAELLEWHCDVLEADSCAKWVRELFQKWVEDPVANPLPPHVRDQVLRTSLRHASRAHFELVYRRFLAETDPALKSSLVGGLALVRSSSQCVTLLERSLEEIPPQYATVVWSVSRAAAAPAQAYLLANWERVYQRFYRQMEAFSLLEVLGGVFGVISTRAELDQLKSFAAQHKAQLLPVSQGLQKMVDAAAQRLAWTERYARDIEAWLKGYDASENREKISVTPSPGLNSSSLAPPSSPERDNNDTSTTISTPTTTVSTTTTPTTTTSSTSTSSTTTEPPKDNLSSTETPTINETVTPEHAV